MATDGQGRPLRMILTQGQRGDVNQTEALLEGMRADHVLADKSYDSIALRKTIAAMGATALIPCNPTRKKPITHDF